VIDGLIQRVEIFIGWTWLALISLHLLRSMSRGIGSGAPRQQVNESLGRR
jgi:hypothetical protein